jgi:hypothetical protein
MCRLGQIKLKSKHDLLPTDLYSATDEPLFDFCGVPWSSFFNVSQPTTSGQTSICAMMHSESTLTVQGPMDRYVTSLCRCHPQKKLAKVHDLNNEDICDIDRLRHFVGQPYHFDWSITLETRKGYNPSPNVFWSFAIVHACSRYVDCIIACIL